jgi:hypothetical protein
MDVKIKATSKNSISRLEASGSVKEILINEDIMNPAKESISVCFMGGGTSGIVDFSPAEVERLYAAVKGRMHLIKGFKTFRI